MPVEAGRSGPPVRPSLLGQTVWEGWFEFTPVGGRGIVRRSQVETTQPNREALAYWARGIEPIYLEGALERTIASRSDRRARSK